MKPKTILPVSRKFLARIRQRLSEVVAALGVTDTLSPDYLMSMILAYLDGRLPEAPDANDGRRSAYIIFLTLRSEIDAAVTRSRRARECARRRAELRKMDYCPPPTEVPPEPVEPVGAPVVEEPDEKERERLSRIEAFYERKRRAREAEVVETMPDGEVRTRRPDGTLIVKYPDGEIRTTRPNGQVIVQFPGRKTRYYEKWLGDHPYYEEVEDPPIVMKGAPDRNSLAEQIRRAYGLR